VPDRIRLLALDDPDAQFWAKVDRSGGPDSCWIWSARLHRGGYGEFRMQIGSGANRRRVYLKAHRVAYELAVGEIPTGLVLDHLCRTRACVNPAHLEPVTQGENVRRGYPGGKGSTHCRQGHPFDEANTIVRPSGHRACRACKNERRRRNKKP
jgi:hypothetical protein